MIIDLMYVITSEGSTISCGILGSPKGDKMLGPVPSRGGCMALAPMLSEFLPEEFPSVLEAMTYLGLIHLRNTARHENEAGQEYPWDMR